MPSTRVSKFTGWAAVLFAVVTSALFILSPMPLSTALAQPAAGPSFTPSSSPAPAQPSIASQPLLNAALKAQVIKELTDPNSVVSYGARVTLANEPTYASMSPGQLLATATNDPGVAALWADEMQGLQNSNLKAFNFGPLSGYLESAGIGCATSGGGFLVGAAAAWSVSTAGLVAKDNPYTFIATCAIGAAAGLIIYQNGINAANAAVCNACLYQAFLGDEANAYFAYVNLTTAMYSSILSLADFAQVGFDRASDNAALLQIGNNTFNASQDFQQSGIANTLGGLPSSYELQIAEAYRNVPEWLGALAGKGAYFDGYAEAVGFPITSQLVEAQAGYTGVNTLSAAVMPSAGIYGGLVLTAATNNFYYAGVPGETGFITQGSVGPSCATPCVLAFAPIAGSGNPQQRWLNLSVTAADLSASEGWTFNNTLTPGWYQFTQQQNAYFDVVIPTALQFPTAANSFHMGTFGWAASYFTTTGAYESGHNGGGCTYTSEPVNHGLAASSFNAGDSGPSVGALTWTMAGNGDCGASGSTTILTTPNPSGIVQCAPTYAGSGAATNNSCITSGSAITTLTGQLIANATLSGQVYWAFIRSLGYTSLGSIPANCIIPAPYMALPSQFNVGNLTLNQSVALYESFLQGMGNFYGASSAFSVCHGAVQSPYNYTTWVFANLYVETWASIYINNGTAAVNGTGAAMAGEHYGNVSTWAFVNATCTPALGGACVHPLYPPVAGQTTIQNVLIAPTLKSIAIPTLTKWAVPADNPLLLFAYNNHTGLNVYRLNGNGTRDLGPNSFGSRTGGDSLYLNACFVNGTSVTNCTVTLTTWDIYVGQGGPSPPTPPPSPPSSGTNCPGSSSLWVFGSIVNGVANVFSGIPLIGTGIGCFIGYVVLVALIIVLIYVAVAVINIVRGRR
jgi:hypothetical protein